jgi:hypothetical protein
MKTSNKILLLLIVVIITGGIALFSIIIINSDFIDSSGNSNSYSLQFKNIFKSKNTIHGNGIEKKVKVKLPTLNGIVINGIPRIEINYSDKNEMVIEGDENIVEKIKHLSIDNKLTLFFGENLSIKPDLPFSIKLNVKHIDNVIINGASKAKIDNVKGRLLDLTTNGASEILLNGKVETFNITCRGAGEVIAEKLIAQSVNAELYGATEVTVYAEKELNINAYGASTVSYYGKPDKVKRTMFGAGELYYKGLMRGSHENKKK